MSKFAGPLLGLLLSATAAGQSVKNPETFIYAITGEVDSLDPHWQFDAISHAVQFQIYDNLIAYKGPVVDAFEPAVASVVPDRDNGFLSADGLTYRFPIRKKVRFHDGSELTPEDVKYSLMRFLLMDRASGPSFLLLDPLLGVRSTLGADGKPDPLVFDKADSAIAVEGGAVTLRLRQPYAPLLALLASACPIISKAWTVKNGGWDGRASSWPLYRDPPKQQAALYDKANGTGPFKLLIWDRTNKQLVLLRHENYWRKPARLSRVVYKTVAEFSSRKLMLENGDADAIMIEREYLPQLEGIAGVKILDDELLLETHNAFIPTFKINPQANPYIGSGKLDGRGLPPDFFADIDVRRGFAHAFDYDAYIKDGYRGKGQRAHGPIPKGVFGYNSSQALKEYDLKKAAEYFQKAFGGELWEKGFVLTLAYMEGRSDRRLACSIMKKNVESINPRFRVDIRGIPWSTMLDAFSAGKLPLINGRWVADYPDPDNFVFGFLHSQGYYPKAQGYSNPRADRLIEQARGELVLDKRRGYYAELQAIAYADIPQIYTLDTSNVEVMRTWVKGWVYNPIIFYGYFYPVYKEEL